jgi:hypothetical protein
MILNDKIYKRFLSSSQTYAHICVQMEPASYILKAVCSRSQNLSVSDILIAVESSGVACRQVQRSILNRNREEILLECDYLLCLHLCFFEDAIRSCLWRQIYLNASSKI